MNDTLLDLVKYVVEPPPDPLFVSHVVTTLFGPNRYTKPGVIGPVRQLSKLLLSPTTGEPIDPSMIRHWMLGSKKVPYWAKRDMQRLLAEKHVVNS